MTEERKAFCKICKKEYSYSIDWANALAEEGRQPTEYCPKCRALHSRMRASLAMPYYKAVPTIPRRPDKELQPGRLGRLTHIDRNHHTVSNIPLFYLPGSDIDFGIKDDAILELFEILDHHKITVVMGPTGSGKSTFLPYRLMSCPEPYEKDHFTRYGQIIVTQPRIQAARTIPEFVARDLHGSTLGAGGDIGFIHHGERAADSHAKLIYCTDGILINWISSGRIGNFSIIMIDEAHERSLNIDVILGLLKMRLPLYPNLKLIIASATIDSELFIKNFSLPGQPVGFMNFAGYKRFSFKKGFRERKLSDHPRPEEMAETVSQQVFKILQEIARGKLSPCLPEIGPDEVAPEGDILAFMPTVASINKTANSLRQSLSENRSLNQREIEVHELHRQLPMEQQNLALRKKYQAIGAKTIEQINAILKKHSSEGDLIAYTLDEKSAQDCIQLLLKYIEENTNFHGTAVGHDFENLSAPKWTGKPNRSVIVTTYEKSLSFVEHKFFHQIHDRRVVISTNIAETSLTVDGIIYVVDSGLILRKEWNLDTLTESFRPTWHSQDGCKQRWGRAGRVRNGFAYTMYTQKQFEDFDSHTIPEIQRAPLEAVVLTAKRAGIDNVIEFPWIQSPEQKELKRAVTSLTERGLLDKEGDLTETGQMVSSIQEEPNIGHLLVIADQLACVQEGSVLAAMLQYKPRGGLLRWQNKWDGHTRRLVRKIHSDLETGCEDDLAFYMKIFYAWSQAWRPEMHWLTNDIFPKLWSDRIPQIDSTLEKSIGKPATHELEKNARHALSIDDLNKLVEPYIDKPFMKSWLMEAENALRDARSAAWARIFFVNHDILKKVDKKRRETLAQLAIGKKTFEDRPLNFGLVLERLRFALAYAWSDRIYLMDGYKINAAIERIRQLESELEIQIGHDSLVTRNNRKLPGFVCGRRAASSKGVVYVSMLARYQPEWLSALHLPVIEAARWFAVEWNNEERGTLHDSLFLDQNYPFQSRWESVVYGAKKPGVLIGETTKLLSSPRLITETAPDGQILYVEDPVDGDEKDLDSDTKKSTAAHSFQDNDEVEAIILTEEEEKPRIVSVNLIHAAGSDHLQIRVDDDDLLTINPQATSNFFVLDEGNHHLIITVPENPQTILLDTQFSVESGKPYLLILILKEGDLFCRIVPCQEEINKPKDAEIRLIHAVPGIDSLELFVDDHSTTRAISYLELTPYQNISEGDLRISVRMPGQSEWIIQIRATSGESWTIVAVPDSINLAALVAVMEQPNIQIQSNLDLKNNGRYISPSSMLLKGDLLSQPMQTPVFDSWQVGDRFPSRVVGYITDKGNTLLIKPDPIPGAFEEFCTYFPPGSQLSVRVIAIDQDEIEDYQSLVVQPEGLDLEIVMEAQDLTFSGRQSQLGNIETGKEFNAMVRDISIENSRIYLSLLPMVETFLPEPETRISGTTIEKTHGGGVYLALDSDVGDLPVPIVVFVDEQNLPKVVNEAPIGSIFSVKIAPSERHERHLKNMPQELMRALKDPVWKDHVGWDEAGQKIWVDGRLIDSERDILRQVSNFSSVRWAIDNLYRISNSLEAFLDFSQQKDDFLRLHPVESKVNARITNIKKNELFASVEDTMVTKITLAEVKNSLRRKVEEGDELEVVVKGFIEKTGYLWVQLITRTEDLQQRFPLKSLRSGSVTRVEHYGVFVKLGEDVSGMVHISQLGYQQPQDAQKHVKVGDNVDVQVLNISDDGKIALTMRHDAYNPALACPINDVLDGEVVHLLPMGALVKVKPGVVGMIHISELAWKRVEQPAHVVSPGQHLKVRVLKVHGDPPKIDLSLKSAYQTEFSIPKDRIRNVLKEGGQIIRDIKANTNSNIVIDPNGTVHIRSSSENNLGEAKKRVIEASVP